MQLKLKYTTKVKAHYMLNLLSGFINERKLTYSITVETIKETEYIHSYFDANTKNWVKGHYIEIPNEQHTITINLTKVKDCEDIRKIIIKADREALLIRKLDDLAYKHYAVAKRKKALYNQELKELQCKIYSVKNH